jgi:cytochrome o ubiquinol oxidase subunit II
MARPQDFGDVVRISKQRQAQHLFPGPLYGLALCAGLLFSRPASAAHLTFLDPQGPVASAQRTHLIGIVLLVMVVVLPVLILTPIFAWRYRYRNSSAPYTPKWSFSRPLEIIIWGVPFAIVAILAVWLWQSAHALDPYSPISSGKQPLRVQVIGYDWKWLFIYPDLELASMGQLVFPADKTLAIEITSDTVMQSFFIPALGSQIYAMAGMTTRLHLDANAPGHFLGENTQFSGKGFDKQKFIAQAMSPADYKSWIKQAAAVGIPLTPKVYDTISKQSTTTETRKALHADRMPAGVLLFTGVSPNLFGNVVRSFHGGAADAASLLGGKRTVAKSTVDVAGPAAPTPSVE